jgi:dUTP pyrophosphatase
MLVKIVNKSSNALPQYETGGSAGLDVRSAENVTIAPGSSQLIKTGLFIEIPYGYEIQVRPRSGLALKHGITVLNSPGTIDSDYRGEIGVILINHGQSAFEIKSGDRIAQLVMAKVEHIAMASSRWF